LLEQRFGTTMFTTRIRRTVKLEEAHSRGEDVFTYAPDSTGAQDYAQLVEEVIAHA
jgi:chromosome partitioning protein